MRGKPTFALVAAIALAASLGLVALSVGPRSARAACDGDTADPEALFSFQPPQTGDFQVTGPAPLAVSATWLMDVLTVSGSKASLNWGDGSAPTPFTAQDCGDDTINWPVQTLSHTYASPGEYLVLWNFSLPLINISHSVPIAMVVAQSAQAPTLVPTVAATPTSLPAATATPVAPTPAPPTPAPTPVAIATDVPATPTVLLPTAPPVPQTPTPTVAQATATRTATPTVIAAVIAGTSPPAPSPSPSFREPDLPPVLAEMPRIGEISTDSGTVATNIVLAGVTLWVLFSSVFLNQVLQDNRAELDEKAARLTRPLRRVMHGVTATKSAGTGVLTAIIVLGGTGVIYGFLNPGFGLNRPTILLVLSAVVGVGIVTYVCSGLEAAVTRRSHGLNASVRPYPAAMAMAVASVLLSRLIHLQPGVVYGFVASASISGPGGIERRRQGGVTIFPVLAALALSVVALLIVEPLRANETAATSFLGQFAIGVGVIVFVGGVEGVFFNMVPISVTDGGKLFAWRKPVWAAVAMLASFLAWHVLLNRDRESFDALREASTVAVLVVFAFYSLLSLALWLYFSRRSSDIKPVAHLDPAEPTL